MTKDTIRDQIRTQFSTIAPDWITSASNEAQERLIALDEFKAASVVCCYMSFGPEAETGRIISECHAAGKRLCVPVYDRSTKLYYWAWLAPDAELTSGPWDIPEPVNPVPVPGDQINLVVVPGVAFDRSANRLGHGNGFYDRLLVSLNSADVFMTGLAFDFQIVNTVPVDEHDIQLNSVITEQNVFRK